MSSSTETQGRGEESPFTTNRAPSTLPGLVPVLLPLPLPQEHNNDQDRQHNGERSPIISNTRIAAATAVASTSRLPKASTKPNPPSRIHPSSGHVASQPTNNDLSEFRIQLDLIQQKGQLDSRLVGGSSGAAAGVPGAAIGAGVGVGVGQGPGVSGTPGVGVVAAGTGGGAGSGVGGGGGSSGLSGGAGGSPSVVPPPAAGAAAFRQGILVNPTDAMIGEAFPTSEGESLESSVSEDTTWISWFCSLKGNEFFCEVDEDFIQDDFNLTGLSSQVTYYNYALDTILDVDIPEGELDERQQELVEVSAETLYGLIHARYILTARGMHAMLNKYNDAAFGRCPRVYCGGQPVLPVGQSDLPRLSTVKIFCPMCWDIFFPRSRHHNTLDGAYWGTSFPHLFLQTNHYLVPQRPTDHYVPRIFGFKIHQSSLPVQRNLGVLNKQSEMS